GSGFRRGAEEIAFSTSGGFGTRSLGSHRRHDLALITARYGRSLGRSWEFLAETFGGVQTHPRRRTLFGLTPIMRYHIAMGGGWVPFLDGGAGPTYTSIRQRDLSTTFEFNVQAGGGVHYFLGTNRSLTLLYRWLHLSNAGMKLPNDGANTQMLSAGL